MPPPQPSHRPRKKRKDFTSSSSSHGATRLDLSSGHEQPAFPLSAFFWPCRSNPSPWILLPIILMSTFLFRWTTSLWPYSGQGKLPMHGDFEAQRHWMELTTNLPVTHWYFHHLEWWGLDYPPLTAYHSWLLGKVGSLVDSSWFALYLSRGLDDADLKVFMRASVVVSEYLVYIPAAVVCTRHLARLSNINTWESSIALTAVLMQPATILIDHGHFQYNTVMLGLFLASLSSMLAGRNLWACVFFVGALGFKQMALFYAPAVAAYLAGSCLSPRINLQSFLAIAVVATASFALLYLPFLLGTAYDQYRGIPLPSDAQLPPLLTALPIQLNDKGWYHPYLVQLAQCVHRIFPFSRGLFEDKVANIWCAIHASGIHKLHNYAPYLLSRASLALTLASITPPCLLIFFRPRKELLPLAFAATSWGFFLCGFQVHEKNVLLPLLPMTLLLATRNGMLPATRAWVGFANILGSWTLFPLLVKDQLRLPYFVLAALYAYLLALPPFSLSLYTKHSDLSWATVLLHMGIYAAMFLWHTCEWLVPPPERMPDLWIVGNVCLGAGGFGMCYLWCLRKLVKESEVLNDLSLVRKVPEGDGKKTQ